MFLRFLLIFCFTCVGPFLNAFHNYEISDLSLGDIQDIEGSQATCINNNGEVAGGLFIGGMNLHFSAFLWTKEMGLVEIFPNKAFPPSDMNDATQIVGCVPEEYDPPSGYLWSLESGYLGLKPFRVCAINDYGVMTGNDYCTKYNSKLAYIKTSLQARSEKLELVFEVPLNKIYMFLDYSEHPIAINNKCEVIGFLRSKGYKLADKYSKVNGFHTHGFLWSPEGKCIDFGNQMIPTAINNLSQVVLVSNFSEKGSSWLWENGKFISLWNNGLAQAINNGRVVIGSQNDNAVIWENEQMRDLINLVINRDGWSKLSMAMDINDRGEIVGRGIYKGKETAFLLIPCEP